MQKLKNNFAEFNLKERLSNLLPLVENNSSKIILERVYSNLNREDVALAGNIRGITEKQENIVLVGRLQVLESLIKELKVYDWHKDISAFVEEANNFLSDNQMLIILESVIFDLNSDKNSSYYEKVVKKIQECSAAEKPVEAILETLETEKWIPLVKRLYQYAETLKGSYNGKNPNFEVSSVYSPVEMIGESVLIHSNGLNLLVNVDEGKVELYTEGLSNSFRSLCQIAENAKFDKGSMRVYPNKQHTLDIQFLSESTKVLLDGKEIAAKDLDTYLVTKGIVSFNESAKLGSLQRAINEGHNIKNIDIAYKVKSRLYEGVSATVFNVNDNLFVQLTNHGMKENRIVEAESAQDAIALVKEHMNFDITESVKYLIDEENRKEVQKEKAVAELDEKINFLKENIEKIIQFEKENGESESITEAKSVLEEELVKQEAQKKTLTESKDDFVNGELAKSVKLDGLGGTYNVKINALKYTRAGDKDKVDIITSTGKEYKIEKKFLIIKI